MSVVNTNLLLGIVEAVSLVACGSNPSDQEPAIRHLEWSLTVGEPNERCPGTFHRSVSEWRNEADVKVLSDAIARMPKNVKQAACRVAKFTIEPDNFLKTGVMRPGIDLLHSEVGFHPALFRLKPTLSQLLIWKDRQIVEVSQRPRFENDNAPLIVSTSSDDFNAALSYVLAHELGHVAHFQAEWRNARRELCNPDCEANSWERDGVKPGHFKAKGKFCFYGRCDQHLSAVDLPKVYDELASSDFISLYASTDALEDVAESYAATIIFDVWKWTWKTTAGGRTFSSAEHWTSPQMNAKRDLISKLAAADLPPP